MKYSFFLVIVSVFFAIVVPVQSQNNAGVVDIEPALILGEKHTISSSILGEERPYTIYLPDSYTDSTYTYKKYPVLFSLAGGDLLAKGITKNMSFNPVSKIPEVILVSIPFSNFIKYHSYLTPTRANKLPDGREIPALLDVTGRGNDFLTFLSDELLPHIDSTYRTLPYRILTGHSIAGLFTLQTYLSKKKYFQAFIAIDPSLWWDEQIVVKQMEKQIAQEQIPGGNVYLAMASRPREGSLREGMNGPINKFKNLLQLKSSKNLHFSFQDFPNEHHNSVWPFAFYNGLMHVFQGYQPAPDQFSERPETILPHFQKISARLGVDLLPPESLLDRIGKGLLYDATATAKVDTEKLKKGLQVLQVNLEIYPNSFHAHQALANAFAAMDNEKMATKHYRHSLALNPDNEKAKKILRELNP